MFGVSGLRIAQLQSPETKGWTGTGRLRFVAFSIVWILGHSLGGLLVGGLVGWLGTWLGAGVPWLVGLFGVGCLLGACRELGWSKFPLPSPDRQVDRNWMWTLPWSVTALGYGVQLGSAVTTRIQLATTYAALGAAFLTSSPLWGGAVMASFGFVRALPPILFGPWFTTPTEARKLSSLVDRHRPAIRMANGVVLLGCGILLLGLGIRPIWMK